MRLLLALLVLQTLSFAASAAEIITLTVEKGEERNAVSAPVTLNAGDTAEIVYTSDTNIRLDVTIGEKSFWLSSTNTGSSGIAFNPTIPIIAGPAQIRLVVENPYYGDYKALASLKITRAIPAATAMVPSTAVVIPNDAEGQFEVILESSIDMITWTPALPGTYDGSNPNRFFRTRIVKKP